MTALVLGIDASIAATGLALPAGYCRTLAPSKGADDIAGRLDELGQRFSAYLARNPADVAVIEEYARPSGKNTGTAPFRIAELGGVFKRELYRWNVPFVTIPATSLKKYATGKGTAQKHEMVLAAKNRGASVANDNEADAWWLRQIAIEYLTLDHDAWQGLESHQIELHGRIPWPKGVTK